MSMVWTPRDPHLLLVVSRTLSHETLKVCKRVCQHDNIPSPHFRDIIEHMTDITPLHPNARDRKQVETLAGLGASLRYISIHLKLDEQKLKQYYQEALDYGQEHANLEVAETFFQLATSGDHPNITAQWMKMRAGWSETFSRTPQEEDDTSEDLAREKLLKLLNRQQA